MIMDGQLAHIARCMKVGDWHRLAQHLGFDIHPIKLPRKALGTWGIDDEDAAHFSRLAYLGSTAGTSLRLMLVEGEGPDASFRRLAIDVHRHNPGEVTLWWWVRPENITAAFVDEKNQGRPFLRRIQTDRVEPDPVGLRQWLHLSTASLVDEDGLEARAAWRRHLREVLGQEGLTREFFEHFCACLGLLEETMQGGPADPRQRHELCLTILLRLVFVYFLQSRGALDSDRRFVLRHLRESLPANDEGSGGFYRHVLYPFFFGALNVPAHERSPSVKRLGELPFLNGGLFEPLPVEKDYGTSLAWPDRVWRRIVEDLLEHYHFAIEIPSGGDECRAVDPEMLGKVFEGLMYGDLRKASGSFYTPRDVVRAMVEEVLRAHLADKTSLDPALLASFVAGHPANLSKAAREELADVLGSLRILDPAVGTGAFLVESLHVLEQCWRTLGYQDPSTGHLGTRDLIHRHLFGVDIQPVAVRLCELRLWLAIMSKMPDMPVAEIPPLPNLAHRICCGDSLIDPLDMVRLRSASKVPEPGGWAPGASAILREHLAALMVYQEHYLTAHGTAKLVLRKELEGLRRRMYIDLLASRRERLVAIRVPLTQLEAGKDLFGKAQGLTDAQRDLAKSIDEELSALDEAASSLDEARRDATRREALGFSYQTHFEPMANGGFDIVLTNPPWIRSHDIDQATRKLLKARYASDDHRLWPGARELGIRATFGAQADMSALFVERSLELLKPGGRLCALVPAKLFRSLHGSALRTLLASHHVESIEDFSLASRAMFEATTYPAIVQVKKGDGAKSTSPMGYDNQAQEVRVALWQGESRKVWTAPCREMFTLGEDPGEPWLFVEPSIRTLLKKVQTCGPLLGSLDEFAPRRGVLTGCNDVYLVDEAQARALLGDDYDTLSRPVLQGRDIATCSTFGDSMFTGSMPPGRILWPIGPDGAPLLELPGVLRDYFEEHRERLEERSDYRPSGPLWQLFRLHDELKGEKVVWRDFSEELEAAAAPAQVIPLNTVYFLPAPSRAGAELLARTLNSDPIRALALAIAERARGGWRRHLAWVMRLLPIPQAIIDAVFDERSPTILDPSLFGPSIFGLDQNELDRLNAWRRGLEPPSGKQEAA